MLERCVQFASVGGAAALVSPQSWLFIGPYKKLRTRLLRETTFNLVAQLGPRAFQTISGEIVNVNLVFLTRSQPNREASFAGIDASELDSPAEKAAAIAAGVLGLSNQRAQLANPDARIVVAEVRRGALLGDYACSYKGIATGDMSRFIHFFWELPVLDDRWRPFQGSVERHVDYGGRDMALLWEGGEGALYRFVAERLGKDSTGAWLRGENAWGRDGIAVSQMAGLTCSLYRGDLFDENTAVVIPKSSSHLIPIYAYIQSDEYARSVRKLDNSSLKIPNLTLIKVPFDLECWRRVAGERYPKGLPEPWSEDPTQWVFHGHPAGSEAPLQVAVARLLGYRWPAELDAEMRLSGEAREWVRRSEDLLGLADRDGIVCLSSLRNEEPAAARLRELLATSFGGEWNANKERELLLQTPSRAATLEEWLRDRFFAEHCDLFHQRPFVWHLWDGRKDGFHALIDYHRLANGTEGRMLLETLTYAYLGEWIDRQRRGAAAGEIGADARLAAALELQSELRNILHGEKPYDLFIRWKPLRRQPIGWEPDLDDGVRINARPFLTATLSGGRTGAGLFRAKPNIQWKKDRGTEPHREESDFPWFWRAGEFHGERHNHLQLTLDEKRRARALAPTAGVGN